MTFTISPGAFDDFLALKDHHYTSGIPRAIARIVRVQHGSALAGVLVVTFPALNDNWRERAFGPSFANALAPKQRAAHINRHIRSIARVIIAPRFRSLGLATALVRHYLRTPLTALTEAISALNDFIPLFERGGMRPLDLEPPRRDERLQRMLAAAGLTPLDLATLSQSAGPSHSEPALIELRRALARWAAAHRATRTCTDHAALARSAARSLLTPRRVFVAGTLTEGQS